MLKMNYSTRVAVGTADFVSHLILRISINFPQRRRNSKQKAKYLLYIVFLMFASFRFYELPIDAH